MPERTILASFTMPERAQQCQDALRAVGYDVVQVDAIQSNPETLSAHTPIVEWGRYGYEPTMVDDKWTGASSWEHGGLIMGESWLLTAVVPEQDGDHVLQIIQSYGGRL